MREPGSPRTRVGVVSFPGTNCEADVAFAISSLGGEAVPLFHTRADLAAVDAVVIPGGFAYGDYLRAGALARFSPIMEAIIGFAEGGKPVLGICNGFQILTEAGLLPGALRGNAGQKFVCSATQIRVESGAHILSARIRVGDQLSLPVNHFEGNYTCDKTQLAELVANGQVAFTYADNPNGSVNDIAGITNRGGNVVGMMPHPERACSALLGSADGNLLLGGLLEAASRVAS